MRVRPIRLQSLRMTRVCEFQLPRTGIDIIPIIEISEFTPGRAVMDQREPTPQMLQSHIVILIVILVRHEEPRWPRLYRRQNVHTILVFDAPILEKVEGRLHRLRKMRRILHPRSVKHDHLPLPLPTTVPVPTLHEQQRYERRLLKRDVRLHDQDHVLLGTLPWPPSRQVLVVTREDTRIPNIRRDHLRQIFRRYHMIQVGRILGVLAIMRRHPDLINLFDHVVCEMHHRIEHRRLNINVQNIPEIDFREFPSAHLHELPHERINTHPDLNERHDRHRPLQNLLRVHNTAHVDHRRDLKQVLRLLVDDEDRRVAHRVEHLVEDEHILEEPVREQIVIRDRRSGQEDYLAILDGRDLREAHARGHHRRVPEVCCHSREMWGGHVPWLGLTFCVKVVRVRRTLCLLESLNAGL